MKRNIFVVTLALAACVFVSAQDSRPGSRGGGGTPRARPSSEEVTVTGTLGLEKGSVVLTSGGTTYYVPALLRYGGFIDGLKEGAKVTVKGEVFAAPSSSENASAKSAPKTLNVTRLTIGGKDYDISSQSMGGDFPPPGGPGGGGPR